MKNHDEIEKLADRYRDLQREEAEADWNWNHAMRVFLASRTSNALGTLVDKSCSMVLLRTKVEEAVAALREAEKP